MDQSISTIYTPNPLHVDSETSLQECINLMRNRRISCIIVTDANKPVGIYTEADMVRTLHKKLDYRNTRICELMSSPVISAGISINAYEASYILSTHKIRHLVITDEQDELAGIITQTDIIAHYGEEFFMGVKSVSSVMSKTLLTVSPATRLDEVVGQMAQYTAGCAIAIEEQRPLGILTERDLAALIVHDAELEKMQMAEVMSTPVHTICADISTLSAITLMNRERVRRLVVVDEQGLLAGVLIQEDIIRDLENHYIEYLKQTLWEQQQKLASTQDTIKEQNQHLGSLLHSAIGIAIIATDCDFNLVYVNKDAHTLFGHQRAELVGQAVHRLLGCDCFLPKAQHEIKQEIQAHGEYRFIHSRQINNDIHHVESRITPIREEEQTVGYILVFRDITDKLHAEKRLLIASHVFECAVEGIMVTDANGTIQSVNPAFSEITGYSADEVIGQNPRILQSDHHNGAFYKKMWDSIKETGRWQGEIWNRRKNGETYPERLTISRAMDQQGNTLQYTAVFYDITELKEKEERINHRAYHDPLTELPNRMLFKDRLVQAISRARRNNGRLAVMFVDIDHFKRLNDSLGHYAGDQFLQQISIQFRACLRAQDTVSRFAGDEFTILMDDDTGIQEACIVAQKLLELFKEPFHLDKQDVYLGASIGVACYPQDGTTPEALLQSADTAMYHAKESGRNDFQVFHSEMALKVKQRMTLENELRKALRNDEMELLYQPIIDLHSKTITSMEALLRWDGNDAMPNQFIPVAEESGLIIPLGEWVLRQTCIQMSEWVADNVTGLAISVNLSARQFREKELFTTIERILQETALNPEQLHLEITESSVMEDMQAAIATLNNLRKMGIKILMDDFGTGYSSLTCLQKIPVDVLKLDHTFIHDIDINPDTARLAAGIIAMAKDLRLEVVAEGVENEQQLHFLEEHGCDMVQGFLFHKPLNQAQMRDILRACPGQQKPH